MSNLTLLTSLMLCFAIAQAIADELSNFQAPARLNFRLKAQFRQISSGAPPDPLPRSKVALLLPQITDGEPAALEMYDDIKEGIQYVLQTKNEWTFPIHGTGTFGAHAVLDNLIEPGDKVLVLSIGFWGDLQIEISTRLGAKVIQSRKPPGTRFTLQEVEMALRAYRPQILAMVMGESDTTVLQSLDGIGNLCVQYGALFVVDAVAIVGIQPVWMDKLKMDGVYGSSHKGLGGVPGLALVSLSARAVAKLKSRATPPRAFPTDLILYQRMFDTSHPNRTILHSLSIPLLYSLRETLASIAEEGIENTFERHKAATVQLTKGLDAMGLQHFVPIEKERMTGMTAVLPPKGKDPVKVATFIFKNFNILMSSGYGPTKGKVLRFATFGSNTSRVRVSNILEALREALISPETNA